MGRNYILYDIVYYKYSIYWKLCRDARSTHVVLLRCGINQSTVCPAYVCKHVCVCGSEYRFSAYLNWAQMINMTMFKYFRIHRIRLPLQGFMTWSTSPRSHDHTFPYTLYMVDPTHTSCAQGCHSHLRAVMCKWCIHVFRRRVTVVAVVGVIVGLCWCPDWRAGMHINCTQHTKCVCILITTNNYETRHTTATILIDRNPNVKKTPTHTHDYIILTRWSSLQLYVCACVCVPCTKPIQYVNHSEHSR